MTRRSRISDEESAMGWSGGRLIYSENGCIVQRDIGRRNKEDGSNS